MAMHEVDGIPISHEAEEYIDEVAGANNNQLINHEIRYIEIIEVPVRLGQATPWGHRHLSLNIKKFIYGLTAIVCLIAMYVYCFYSGSSDTKAVLPIKSIEEIDPCECSTDVFEKKFGVYTDDQIFNLLTYHDAHIFDEIVFKESTDNSTCLLYDVFSYITTKLCCLKDLIINHTSVSLNMEEDSLVSTEGGSSTSEFVPDPPLNVSVI